jgi:hypothetical protein
MSTEEQNFVIGTRTFAEARCADIEEQAAKGDDSVIWDTFNGLLFTINGQYTTSDIPISVLEEEIHLLWYILIQAARNLSSNSKGQLHMVQSLLQARELGVITRTIKDEATNSEAQQTAETKDGRMWVDLPFLIKDIEAYWIANEITLDKAEKKNFTSFMAKLLALGIGVSVVASIALSSVSRALEVETSSPSEDEIRLACTWFELAGDKLVILSTTSFKCQTPGPHAIGPLVQKAGVTSQGFCSARWLLWMERMKQLSVRENQNIAKLAIYGYLNMHHLIWRTDCAMRPRGVSFDDADTEMCVTVLDSFCKKWPALADPDWLPHIEVMKAQC